jgi:hypothetical protein
LSSFIFYLLDSACVTTTGNTALGQYTGSYYIVNCCIAPTNAFKTNVITAYYYANNIESNPQFVNKDTGNWRLQRTSPCVNAGTNEDWMTLDLDGHFRIDRLSRIVDIGCYEYFPQGTVFSIP